MIDMIPIRSLALATVVASTAGLLAVPAQAVQRPAPVLVAVRAAHQPGFDRLVFEFRGRVPAQREIRYVPRLVADPSGRAVAVVGDALLQIRFARADGHDARGDGTYGPARRTYALPGVIQVVNTGDFEAVLTFGVGLARRVPVHVHTLTSPSRVVVDLATPYRTVPVRDYFLDTHAFRATGVWRPVKPPETAYGALQRLFAGPTQAERAQGLRFVASGATGFAKVTVKKQVARVYLTGNVASAGSAFTVADEIRPTLKHLPGVRWVKIYDATGATEHPAGPADSIPESLEP
ncbi:MAG: GerMN domain-containing protein [Nonomuraea sp.]|nr:GerMN domain-containing protein [Nonomuraea sp.]